MKKLLFSCKFLTVIFSLLLSVYIYAAEDNIPKTINIQGKLTTDSGQPITETKTLTFVIYDGSGSSVLNTSTSVTPDSEGLYSTDIDVSSIFNNGYNFNGKYSFNVDVGGVSSGKTYFSSSPNAFYASTSTYTLNLDSVNGDKLVDGNFNLATQSWTDKNTYNIAVGSATYSVKTSSINENGTSGYVWGMRGANEQGWMSPGSLSISTATTSVVGGIMLGENTGLSNDISLTGVLKLLPATASTIGGVIVPSSNGLSVDTNGTLRISSATTDNLGVVKVTQANGLTINNGTVAMAKASTSALGAVQIGSNINVDSNGVISVNPSSLVIPLATTSSTGTVKVTQANGLTIDNNGTVAMAKASTSALGAVQIGSNINVDGNGVISVNPSSLAIPVATASSTGTVKVTQANGLTIDNNGTVAMGKASTSALGAVQIGDNISVNSNGVISVNPGSLVIPLATTSSTGTVKVTQANGLTIDNNGTVAMAKASTSALGAVQIGSNINIDGNGVISVNPSSLAIPVATASSTGTVKLYTSTGDNTDGTMTQQSITDAIPTVTNDYNPSGTDAVSGRAVKAAIDTLAPGSFTPGTGLAKDGNTLNVTTAPSAQKITNTNTISASSGDDIYVWAASDSNKTNQGWYKATLNSRGTFTTYVNLEGGADLAEFYQSTEKLVPGDVVSIDTTKDNAIVKTKVAEDTLVAGVISTEPAVLMNQNEKGYKLALVGKVPTKVCNEGGAIKRGDLLVSASIPGYAKKAGDNPKIGTVIGKALENSDSQKGTILVLVNLQ